ncbi:hypothetical protein BGZ70_004623 [Mortierella alpina]|uniref:Ras guanine nucleotide exchange factor domain-containing protein n=1 Tax=Mortierella alpina TaxID=64518 RepID=A0A9P6M4L5_MORAP|nr:hypothetical protein BGZ70_004623 [Mortierella alpina]
MASSFNSESGFLGGSRRSSKDSVDSAPGVTLDYLVDQLTIPDYVNTIEQIARTKIFLMIYRKFLRPRELLEMFIERFEELGEFIDEDDEEAKNTRLRICACLYYWLKNHPNDLIHRQTRQRVALFLRERVALFPFLHEIYVKLLPLSSIHYFNSWRWPQGQPSQPVSQCQSRAGVESRGSRSSSVSGPAVTMGSFSDEDSDSGFYDTGASAAATSTSCEHDMDEDKEWGLFDEDEALPEAKLKTLSMDSLAPFSYYSMGRGYGMSGNSYRRQSPSRSYISLAPPRDRRSSTGSLVQQSSPCEMGAFVASRRGSASSINSGQGQPHQQPSTGSTANSTMGSTVCFPEGDPTPLQLLQPMTPIPFISKRCSSQAYRQQHPTQRSQQNQGIVFSGPNAMAAGSLAPREVMENSSVHPLQGRASPLPPPPTLDFSSMSIPFIDITDGAIAAQLTCVEFGLFKKLKPRDMLRQVWKSSKGSAALQACIAHFNFISSWVGTMILSPSKAKNRAKMMEKFITVAKILRDMGNFNTTMAIIGALNTSSIHRLAQTRELLQGKEIWNTFKGLEHLMGSERSFFEYRSALKVQKLPCIPYLGVHLGDLLSISEGNRDFRHDGTIHWQKFCLLAEVISKVMHFQSEPYMIQPDPYISRVITETHVLDDEEMYAKSIETEPGKLQHSRSMSKFNFF